MIEKGIEAVVATTSDAEVIQEVYKNCTRALTGINKALARGDLATAGASSQTMWTNLAMLKYLYKKMVPTSNEP